jgi:glycosyltransferase involved in cell wall biosynthesis
MVAMSQPPPRLPRISVVVPSYNQAEFLPQALDSIFSQAYPDLEVVVMDGGSTDDSPAVIRSFASRLKHWQSRPDGGQSAAINEGMRHCTGELVAWLNSDDYYWRDALWVVGRAHAAHPGCGLYVGNGFRHHQAEGSLTPFCRRHLALDRAALRRGLDYILQPATFFLRAAWEEAGGLDPSLRYCMDWDLLIRLSDRHPAVLINEFLAVSREHLATKTQQGGVGRFAEIARMVGRYAGQEVTPGALFYLLETLRDVTRAGPLSFLQAPLCEGLGALADGFARQFGNRDGFPEQGDRRDHTYLPVPAPGGVLEREWEDCGHLPSVSVVIPSFNQAAYLPRTLGSVFGQGYPRLETIVIDGGSTDGSIDVLRRHAGRLAYWVSEPDRGPAHAINKGLARATGEVVAWLGSDDLYAPGAVAEAARLFAEDPQLDLVYGNALYIDEQDRLYLADHGSQRTGLYHGAMQPAERVPWYWTYIHAIPQPTVFFRRRLLESCGSLDERYQFIFDFELFARFGRAAKVRKLERTQAYYRIHRASKTSDFTPFLIELYRFSRPLWPSLFSPRFPRVLFSYVGHWLNRRMGKRRPLRAWAAAGLVAISAATRVGNPESWGRSKPAQSLPALPPGWAAEPQPADLPPIGRGIGRVAPRYHSLFCSLEWPRYPGHSGGELRDFHILRHLLTISRVEGYYHFPLPAEGRADLLAAQVEGLHSPESLTAPRWAVPPSSSLAEKVLNRLLRWLRSVPRLRPSLQGRLVHRLRARGLPVPGPEHHFDVTASVPRTKAAVAPALQAALEARRPDFLFVSPQTNPVALHLSTAQLPTRLILAAYDVEAVRMERLAGAARGWLARLAQRWEAARARRFERRNLERYDGVVAVSELDRELFVREYGFPAERVHVVDNGVDTHHFAFRDRPAGGPPVILLAGNLRYAPNHEAALRLVERIMPAVWKEHPAAQLWIVGPNPAPALLANGDGQRVFVTGRVDDVRPYLAAAALSCIPLATGSGTKLKVLEALSTGLPVVATALAAEGLDVVGERHLLLAETDADLSGAVLRLLRDPALSAALARQGRALVEARYSWERSLAGLEDWLALLARLPRRGAGPGELVGGAVRGRAA